jgi:hypothetical protein
MKSKIKESPELETVALLAEIHQRALLFCVDNPRYSNHLEMVKTVMMIGVSIALEKQTIP